MPDLCEFVFVPRPLHHCCDELVGEDEALDAVEQNADWNEESEVLDPAILQYPPESRTVA